MAPTCMPPPSSSSLFNCPSPFLHQVMKNHRRRERLYADKRSYADVEWFKKDTGLWPTDECPDFDMATGMENIHADHNLCFNMKKSRRNQKGKKRLLSYASDCSDFDKLVGLGALFLACEVLGKMFDDSFPRPALLFFFFQWRSARAHWFHSSCQGQSTVALRAETTVAECSLTSCLWARFQIGSHTMPGQLSGIASPLRLRWIEGVCVFRCNLPPCTLAIVTGVFYVPLR